MYNAKEKATPVCTFFASGLKCAYGLRCKYRHASRASQPECSFYNQGKCTFGDNCIYKHVDRTEMWKKLAVGKKDRVCHEVAKGKCDRGDKCAFAHSEKQLIKQFGPNFEYNFKESPVLCCTNGCKNWLPNLEFRHLIFKNNGQPIQPTAKYQCDMCKKYQYHPMSDIIDYYLK